MVESEKEAQTVEEAKRGFSRGEGAGEAKRTRYFGKNKIERFASRYLIKRVYEEVKAHESSPTSASDQAPSRATSEGYEAAVGEAIDELFKDFDERLSTVNRRLDRVLEARG